MRRDIDDGNRTDFASDDAEGLARLAREESRPKKRNLAGLRDEAERQGARRLQRRRRGSALLRLDRRRHEIDRRNLFRATVQPAPEREEPALGDEQGTRPSNDPRRINDAGRPGKNSGPNEREVCFAAGHCRGAETRSANLEELSALPEMVSARPRRLARYVARQCGSFPGTTALLPEDDGAEQALRPRPRYKR